MKVKAIISIYILTLAFSINAKSQCLTLNLIKNSNLEDYTCCPNNMTLISCAIDWTQPLTDVSTSEYFNVCGIDSLYIPNILSYFQHAYFGNGYAGIRVYNYSQPFSNREYIQGTLSETLIFGQCYYCEFWTKLFNLKNTSPFVAIDALSIFFSDTLPKKISTNLNDFNFPAQINNTVGHIIYDTTNWTKISGSFIASGGERYFTVGTFKYENEINKNYFGTPPTNFSYYFFDNFSLCPCEDTVRPKQSESEIFIPNIFTPNNDGHNDVFYVRSLQIESLHLMIYNRWGNKVFESNDIKQGWDGTYHGLECGEGVFFYVAAIVFTNGKNFVKKGNVTLVK